MYGATKKPSDDAVPLVNVPSPANVAQVDLNMDFELENPFDEKFDDQFWNEVTVQFNTAKEDSNVTWLEVVTRVRLDRIRDRYEGGSIPDNQKLDTLVALLTTVHDGYKAFVEQRGMSEVMPNFVKQLSEFADILLQDDFDSGKSNSERKYGGLLKVPGNIQTTILHIVAERDMLEVAKSYVSMYKGNLYIKSITQPKRLPVELALQNRHDNTASFLIKSMLNERVRNLFQNTGLRAQWKFGDFIRDPGMQKTVSAILDSCMNPDWPYLPVKKTKKDGAGEGDEVEAEAWDGMPDMPLRYHFYYKLLDSDEFGRAPTDAQFDHRSPSNLRLISNFSSDGEAIKHPVVRQLVRRKWNLYGNRMIKVSLLAYVVFLMALSCTVFLHARAERNRQMSVTDPKAVFYFRVVCEIVTALFTIWYIIGEVDQCVKEYRIYFFDWYNWIDVCGLLLIVAMVPLYAIQRVDATKNMLAVAAAAYLINVLRVFKYFPAFRDIGVYSKTFAQIIYTDIKKFMVVYFVVMLAFTGGVHLSAIASGKNVVDFPIVLYREFRALAQATAFEDDYTTSYHWLFSLFLLVNMFVVMVIMTNILIGQLSYRYEQAMTDATVQFDIDKARLVTSVEDSWFRRWNSRINHYKEGDFVSDLVVVQELLQDWYTIQSQGAKERTQEAVSALLDKRILKRKS